MKLGDHTFWAAMNGIQKQDCIDARRYRAIDSSKAWPPKGPLLEKWREVLQIILKLVNEPTNNDYIFCKSAHPRVHLCELLLMGQKPVGANVKPTIVVFCRQKKYAKRMVIVLQKSRCMSRLSLGFDYLAHDSFQHDIFRIAGEAEAGDSSPSLSYQDSLCGAAITVVSNDKDGIPKSRVATLGGLIEVNDQLYGMTTAHALLGSPSSSDSPRSSETDDSDLEEDASDDDSETFEPIDPFQTALPREHIENNEAHAYRVYLWPPTGGHSSQRGPASNLPERLLSTHTTDSSSMRPIISMMNNVALLPIADSHLPRTNLISTNEGVLRPTQLSRDISEGPVVVASGVSGVRRTSMSGVLRGIILPNSRTMVPCVTLEGTSVEGDSGSWVVDPSTGDVQAMVVATSASANETYCMPMSAVLAGLEESNTDALRISLPRVPDDNPTPAFHDANEEPPPSVDDEDLPHGILVVDRLPKVTDKEVSAEWPEESALPTNAERLTSDDRDATQLDVAHHQESKISPVQHDARRNLAKADHPPLDPASQLSASEAQAGAVSLGSASTGPKALRGSVLTHQTELRINQHTLRSSGLRTTEGPPIASTLNSSPAQNTSQNLSGDLDRQSPESLSIRITPLPAGRSETPTKKKPAPSPPGRDSRSAPSSQTPREESRSPFQEQRPSSSQHRSSQSEGLLTISRGPSRDDLLGRFGYDPEDRPRPPRQSQQSNRMRVHRDILFPDTLEAWSLPWRLDPQDSMYVIIERLLNEELLEELYKHTDMLRQRQENEIGHTTHARHHQDRVESQENEYETESSSTMILIGPASTQNATEQRGVEMVVGGRERIRTRRPARRRSSSYSPGLPERRGDEGSSRFVRNGRADGRDVQRQKRQQSPEQGTTDHNVADDHNPTGYVLPPTILATEPSIVNRSLAWLVEQHHDQGFLSTLREVFYKNDLPHEVYDHLAEQFSQVQAARRAAVSGLASAGVPSDIPMNTMKRHDSRPERTGTPGTRGDTGPGRRSRGATLNYPVAEAPNLKGPQGPQYLQQPTPVREPQSLRPSLLRYGATGLDPIPGSPMPPPTTTTTLLISPSQLSATPSPAENPLNRVDTRSSTISNAPTPKPRPYRNESIYDTATNSMILLIRGGRETISAAAFNHYSDLHWEYSTQNPNDIIVKPWISDRMVVQLMEYTQHYRDAQIKARIRGDLESGDEWEDRDDGAVRGGKGGGSGGSGLGLGEGRVKRTKSMARRKSRWPAQPATLTSRGNGAGMNSGKAASQRGEEKEMVRPRPRPQSLFW